MATGPAPSRSPTSSRKRAPSRSPIFSVPPAPSRPVSQKSAPSRSPIFSISPAPSRFSRKSAPFRSPTPFISPTPSISLAPSPSPTPSISPAPSPAPTPSISPAPSPAPTPSISPAPAPAPTPSISPALSTSNPLEGSNSSAIRALASHGIKQGPLAILIIAIVVVFVIMLVVAFIFLRRSKKKLSSKEGFPSKEENLVVESQDGEEIPTVESLNYSLRKVQNATNNFSEDCKIGQGGFGIVYKGTLSNGQEVAVKRLSKSSMQGLEEFENEILLLAKLKHKNLVRLLGFCFENQEMILIYEFFRNKSLDNFLFDPEKRRLLDWKTRHVIIEGIAKGLLYLHEDSQLKIIHRDLKPSNVLLDDNMNPKIADFGTARLLQLDQSKDNTVRIAGTYGYMSPEYAIHGQISVKSDVFSFGVLLLEIISGQKNNTFYESNGVDDLGSYAWKNFTNGSPLALLDLSIGELYTRIEVIHCIHVGLLCVQYDPQSRPTMASVVIMLSSNTATLPIPLQPAFLATSCVRTGNVMQPEQPDCLSGRDASFTELYPR